MEKLLVKYKEAVLSIPIKIYESDFRFFFYQELVPMIGGNIGSGVMGKMGWDACNRNAFRELLFMHGVQIVKDPPEVLPGFEIDDFGKVVRINRFQFPF